MIRSALFASLMVAHSAVVVLWGQAWTITKSCLLFPAISGKHMIACYYCNSTILCVCKHTAHDWRQVWPSYWGTGRKGTSITHEHGHGAATASNPLKSALSNRFSNCPFRNHALRPASSESIRTRSRQKNGCHHSPDKSKAHPVTTGLRPKVGN